VSALQSQGGAQGLLALPMSSKVKPPTPVTAFHSPAPSWILFSNADPAAPGIEPSIL